MPIPIGILAVSGAKPPVAMELIATQVLNSNRTVTFSSIPQEYKHLQVRFTSRVTSPTLTLRLNNDSTASYSRHMWALFGTNNVTQQGVSQTSANYGSGVTSSMPTGLFHGGIMDIYDYSNTSKNTVIRTMSAHNQDSTTQGALIHVSNLFFKTNAVTSLNFLNTFLAGSRLSLYGVR